MKEDRDYGRNARSDRRDAKSRASSRVTPAFGGWEPQSSREGGRGRHLNILQALDLLYELILWLLLVRHWPVSFIFIRTQLTSTERRQEGEREESDLLYSTAVRHRCSSVLCFLISVTWRSVSYHRSPRRNGYCNRPAGLSRKPAWIEPLRSSP